MFYNGTEESETINNISVLFKNLLFGSFLGVAVFNFKRISSYFLNIVFYPPGVGKVKIKDFRKTKVAIVSSEHGELRVPVIKCPSFELSMGFFSEGVVFEEGLQDISDFERFNVGFPKNKILKNIGPYWITDIQRPCNFDGRKIIYGFIISYLDGLIYLFKVNDNKIIDYKKIINNYEDSILEYTPTTKEEFCKEEFCKEEFCKEEFCKEEFCKEEFCTTEGEFCTTEGEFCTTEGEFCTTEGEFCTTEGEFCTTEGEFCTTEGESIFVKEEVNKEEEL